MNGNNKLALGTVQFGTNYGVSNTKGKVSQEEVGEILKYAKAQGITTLDTAQGYGDSENTLGNFDLSGFRIITKLSVNNRIEQSLENLKVQNIYGLMFHREDEIDDISWLNFENYKSQKLVNKIGVSVYSPEKLFDIIKKYPIDIVQLPLNVLDQRFLPFFPELKKRNIEIHSRSTFLQGLLLMDIKKISPYFNEIKPLLEKLPKNKLQASINFIKSIKEIDKIVFGVTSKKELEQIFLIYNIMSLPLDYSKFAIQDEKYINPSKWRI